MNETRLRTIAQLEDFLKTTPEVSFSGIDEKIDNERYEHISRVLRRFDYPHRKKSERGVILAYLQHTSGQSRAQIKRLVARWPENRLAEVPLVKRYRAPAAPFARKYTTSDIELLVEMDRANLDVCGPAIQHRVRFKLMWRIGFLPRPLGEGRGEGSSLQPNQSGCEWQRWEPSP